MALHKRPLITAILRSLSFYNDMSQVSRSFVTLLPLYERITKEIYSLSPFQYLARLVIISVPLESRSVMYLCIELFKHCFPYHQYSQRGPGHLLVCHITA